MITSADGNWLAGLIDGEGCFYLAVRPPSERHRRGITWNFAIALRADDAPTLEEARRILGGIGMKLRTTPRRTCPGNPITCYTINNRAEIAQLIEFLRGYRLRSKKARDFEIWAQAYEEFDAALVACPRKVVRRSLVNKPSSVKRRPLEHMAQERFYRIPDELFDRMARYAEEMKATRKYKELEVA